jgi:hypothetical protein
MVKNSIKTANAKFGAKNIARQLQIAKVLKM